MALSPVDNLLRLLARQHWLKGRDRIIRAFCHPDRQHSRPFETDFFGLRYSGDISNFVDWSVFYYGAFAGHELQLLGQLADALRAKGKLVNFFDIGANIGHHTLFMSRHADRVFSFEPFSEVRSEMSRKLSFAGVTNVTIFPIALGDQNETGSFCPPTGANQGTGTLGQNLPDNASSGTISVQVARGDDLFAANHLPPVSLIKMDVEGYETKALAGLRETLWRDRPPIFLEIQPEPGSEKISGQVKVQDLLYPNHLIFDVSHSMGRFVLKPFSNNGPEEKLVIPAELAGILPGTDPAS